MNTLTTNQLIKPWYKEPWPWILMTGPVVVIIAGIITAIIAFSSNDGLIKEDYYKDGLAINQELSRRDNAEKFAIKAHLLQSEDKLRLLLTSNKNEILSEELQLHFVHPQRSKFDQVVTLKPNPPGNYELSIPKGIKDSHYWFLILENQSNTWRLNGKFSTQANQFELAP